MNPQELNAIYEEVKENFEIGPQRVIVVGKAKAGKGEMKFEGDENDVDAVRKYIREKFSFIRTTELRDDLKKEGMKPQRFFHLQVSGFGGETVTLPSGEKVRRSNRSAEYGWYVMFEKADGVNFDEVKQCILENDFRVIGSPDEGKIELKGYALFGAWIKAYAGFKFKLHQVDPATGKHVALISNKIDRETGKMKKEQATDNMIRFFVTEGNYGTLKALLSNRIIEAEKHKIQESAPSEDPTASKVVERENDEGKDAEPEV